MNSNGYEKLLLIVPVEGWLAHQHLIEHDTIRPPVNTGAIWLEADHLWGNVVRGPTEGLSCFFSHYSLLAHPKICDLDVAILIQHDVIKLEVPVDDTLCMEEDDANCYLSCIKPVVRGILVAYHQLNTHLATASLNLPHCCIWYIRSPPVTYSITKYSRSWNEWMKEL